MPFMLLTMPDISQRLNPAVVETILRKSPHACWFRTSSMDVMFDYTSGDDRTHVRIDLDGQTVRVDSMGPADLAAMWEIVQAYPHSLRLIDEGYRFDIDLSKIGSIEELKQRCIAGGHDCFEEDGPQPA